MRESEDDLPLQITIPHAVVAATRDELGRKTVTDILRERMERFLFEEGAYLKRHPPKKQNGNAQPKPAPLKFPRPQMGQQRIITGDDPGTLYTITRTDRCCCGCGRVLAIGTEVIFRRNAENERECWDIADWNEALKRQQSEI